ncbi:MAG: orotidine-5'-phosphate decarboxylase [Pelagibacteraceae bacterium]
MKKKEIFIACDTTSINKIKEIIKNTQTKDLKVGYKIGLEFFNSKKGRDFLSKLKNKTIWYDAKFLDIPNTVASSIIALKDLKNINYISVHISGGINMLKAAKRAAKKINNNCKVIGVSVLTSFSPKSFKDTGHTKSIKNVVVQQARLAMKAGLDGVVCSAQEIKLIRKICKRKIIITPGIRFPDDKIQDQQRVVTPKKAFDNKADAIVMGRSIVKNNIKKNIQKLINSLK